MPEIHFRPLTETDFPLLLKWLQEPHVKAWWDQDTHWTLDFIKQKYTSYTKGYKLDQGIKKPMHAYVALIDDVPIAYVQFYNAWDFERDEPLDPKILPKSLAALDMYIGEPEFLKKGLAPMILQKFLSDQVKPLFTHCLVDPDIKNAAAIQAYEQAGFKAIATPSQNICWMLADLSGSQEKAVKYNLEIEQQHCIINSLKNHYGIDVATLTFLPLGADMNASVYKAVAKDGTSYFVKQKRGVHNDVHLVILDLLHQANIQEIICPIKTMAGQSAQHLDDFSLIVYPFVEGQNGFSHALTDAQWLILGKVLRQVHEVNVPASVQQRLRRETYAPKWRERIRSLYKKMDTTPCADDDIAVKLLAFLKKNTLTIHRLADRAEQLAQKIQNDVSEFVLCHSDIHAGNILISENNALYIVDWDEPIMAPKERDLMFIGAGVCNIWNKSHEAEIFYQGYGKTEVNRDILAYYRCERIVEDMAIYIQELLFPEDTSIDRSEMYKHFMDMFEPNGVVDIAIETSNFHSTPG